MASRGRDHFKSSGIGAPYRRGPDIEPSSTWFRFANGYAVAPILKQVWVNSSGSEISAAPYCESQRLSRSCLLSRITAGRSGSCRKRARDHRVPGAQSCWSVQPFRSATDLGRGSRSRGWSWSSGHTARCRCLPRRRCCISQKFKTALPTWSRAFRRAAVSPGHGPSRSRHRSWQHVSDGAAVGGL